MLELVDQGKLGWTVAHEALAFVGTGHVHQEELEYLATALPRSRVLKDGRKIDKVAVLKIMSNAMGHGTNHQEELEYLATALPRSRVLKDGRKIDKVAVLKIMSNAMGHEPITRSGSTLKKTTGSTLEDPFTTTTRRKSPSSTWLHSRSGTSTIFIAYRVVTMRPKGFFGLAAVNSGAGSRTGPKKRRRRRQKKIQQGWQR